MLKKLLLSALAIGATFSSFAQFNYTLSTRTDTYIPLTGGTSVNDTVIWDDELYSLPLGFEFEIEGKKNDTVFFISDNYITVDTVGLLNLFVITEVDILDRGSFDDSVSHSPIRYEVTGTTPNRIFKLEVANAGIFEEHDMYNTNEDSLNIQVWMYETSNIIELRYGSSQMRHPADYHYLTGSPLMGYMRGFNQFTGGLQKGYYLKGDPTAPTIDSTTNLITLVGGLNTFPVNGTVYRFTPKPTGIKDNAGTLDKLQLLSNTGTSNLLLKSPYGSELSYKVVAINGATLSNSGQIRQGVNNIDISNLPQGMHILYVSGSDGIQSFRINKL